MNAYEVKAGIGAIAGNKNLAIAKGWHLGLQA